MLPAPLEIQSPRYVVRSLMSDDFWHLRRLEDEIWGADATGQLCPYYLRLCTELYPEWCFIAFEGERPVGYVLNFPNRKIAYCATLAVHPDYQKGKVNYLLIRAMLGKLFSENMEECRFLVEPSNSDARRVHHALGARVVREVDDYYHRGDRRLWSTINKDDLDRARSRYTRLRLVS